jgi:hypothetical protein
MASIAKQAVEVVRTSHGGSPVEETYPEAATQTFKKGESVYLVSGYVTEWSDNDSNRMLGFAAEDAHNDTTAGTHNISVWLTGNSGNIFEGNVCTTSGGNQVTAIAQVGELYPLYPNTTNSIMQVNIANTAGALDCARILKIKGVVGDTNGRVEFTIIGTASSAFSS